MPAPRNLTSEETAARFRALYDRTPNMPPRRVRGEPKDYPALRRARDPRICWNAPLFAPGIVEHGPVVQARLCQHCLDVRRAHGRADYEARKLGDRCTFHGCDQPALDDNRHCVTHRDITRARLRDGARRRRARRAA